MGGNLFIAEDESNNGQEFEIHAAVFSAHVSDFSLSSPLLPKIRAHKNLFHRLRKRLYSFLLFTDSDRERIEKSQRLGAITSSLLYEEFDWGQIDSLNLYLDGDKSKKELENLVDMVTAKIPAIEPDKITISWGGKFDQKYLGVNLADELAHYLFRQGIPYASANKHRKKLLY